MACGGCGGGGGGGAALVPGSSRSSTGLLRCEVQLANLAVGHHEAREELLVQDTAVHSHHNFRVRDDLRGDNNGLGEWSGFGILMWMDGKDG